MFLYVFVVLLVSVSYFPFFWARGGQTPGMRFFRLRVVSDVDGSRISGGTAVIRLIGLWISFLIFYLGIIWILVDGRRRGWHDLIAGTIVITFNRTIMVYKTEHAPKVERTFPEERA